jgi:integral membrane protein
VFRTPLNLFRVLAVAEAISWTLLIAGLILRATSDFAIGVTVGGAIHGFVFLSYGATAILVALNQRWGVWPTVVAVVSAVIPYATIPTELWLHRSGRLTGAWRLTATDDPRDAAWHDRLMRWFLGRAWLLAVLIAAAVVVLYAALLVIGPPGGRH